MEATASALSGRRILVVEDDYFLMSDMVGDLERHGAVVVGPAATVEDALALVKGAERLDGAVLDINLQGEMVYPVAEVLESRGVPFVFTTGYDTRTVPARYAGVTTCEKPLEPARIAKALFG